MRDKHPIDFEDLETWTEAFKEPEDEASIASTHCFVALARFRIRSLFAIFFNLAF